MDFGNRTKLIRICAVVFGLLWSGSLAAFPLPPPLETAHLLGKGMPSGRPPVPLTDELYALGWSRSNAFAVLEHRTLTDDQRRLRLRVYDLVEDRVLWEKEWPDWGTADPQVWWTAKMSEVEPVFSRFRLEPTQLQLGVFPLILDNEFYTLVLRSAKSAEDSAWIDRLEIVVHSTGRGLKTVRDGEGFWRWASLVGFIPSPFENRLALVLLVQPAGWQGPRQPLRFLVSGLSLKAGFPKP